MAENRQTVEDVLKKKFEGILGNSNLKSFLHAPCSNELESIFNKYIEIWLNHNQPDDRENCFFGTPFEYHMVGIMGLIGQSKLWQFISWRGDKFIDKSKDSTTFPASNKYADLLYECTKDNEASGFKKGNRIAIECKWTEYNGKSEASSAAGRIKNITDYDEWTRDKYHSYYENALKDGACSFYLAIGVGWDDGNSAPKAVYLVPASAIKDIVNTYNSDNPDNAADKIQSYRLNVNEIPELKKGDSLISTYFQGEKEKKEMNDIIKGMLNHFDSLIADLNQSYAD